MPRYSRKNKKNGKKPKQKGGNFTNEEINELHDLGFTDEHIQILIDNNLTNIQLARNSLQQQNPDTGMPFTPQEIIDSLQINDDSNNSNDSNNSLNESNISFDSDDSEVHDLNDDNLDFNFDFGGPKDSTALISDIVELIENSEDVNDFKMKIKRKNHNL